MQINVGCSKWLQGLMNPIFYYSTNSREPPFKDQLSSLVDQCLPNCQKGKLQNYAKNIKALLKYGKVQGK